MRGKERESETNEEKIIKMKTHEQTRQSRATRQKTETENRKIIMNEGPIYAHGNRHPYAALFE